MNLAQKRKVLYLILYSTVIFAIIMMADSGMTTHMRSWLSINIPFLDKIGHFLGMGALSYFMLSAFTNSQTQMLSWRVFRILAIVVIVVSLEELSQMKIVSRNFSYHDLLADYLGIVFFSLLFFISKNLNSLKSNQRIIYYKEFKKKGSFIRINNSRNKES